MAALATHALAPAPCSLEDLGAHRIGDFHFRPIGGDRSFGRLIGHAETVFARSNDPVLVYRAIVKRRRRAMGELFEQVLTEVRACLVDEALPAGDDPVG